MRHASKRMMASAGVRTCPLYVSIATEQSEDLLVQSRKKTVCEQQLEGR